MKKLLLLLITVSLFTVSCSKEENQTRTIEQSYTLQLNSNEDLSSITIQVKDRYANILETKTVTFKESCNYSTNQGEQLDIIIGDEDSFSGNYTITNNNTHNVYSKTFTGNRNLVIYNLLYQI